MRTPSVERFLKSRKKSLVLWLSVPFLFPYSSFSVEAPWSFLKMASKSLWAPLRDLFRGFDLFYCLIPSILLLFKQFEYIPELPSPPIGSQQHRGTDLLSYLTASQRNIRDAHRGGKRIPELNFHHRTNISYTLQSQDVVVSGLIKSLIVRQTVSILHSIHFPPKYM